MPKKQSEQSAFRPETGSFVEVKWTEGVSLRARVVGVGAHHLWLEWLDRTPLGQTSSATFRTSQAPGQPLRGYRVDDPWQNRATIVRAP